jgi:hypothetical protein
MTEAADQDGAGIWRDPGGTLALEEGSSHHELAEEHKRCIVWCRHPGRVRRTRCQSCYGRAAVRDIEGGDLDPEWNRFAWWLGSFLAGWAAAWRDSTIGMVRRPGGEKRGMADDTTRDADPVSGTAPLAGVLEMPPDGTIAAVESARQAHGKASSRAAELHQD